MYVCGLLLWDLNITLFPLLLRRDLKLILMSATLNAEMFSEYFGEFKIQYGYRTCNVKSWTKT